MISLAVAMLTAASTHGAPGLGDPVYPGVGNGGYDVRRYAIDLDIRRLGRPIRGRTAIAATATQALSRFDLDLAGGTVASVTVNGRRARHRRDGKELVITPRRLIPSGRRFRVVVRYVVDPRYRGKDTGWLHQPGGGFTLNLQPNGARTIFPCNDHPSDKAYFRIRATVPRGIVAVANGSLVSRRRHTFTYASRDPIATELIQLAVGRYAVVRERGPHGLPLRHVLPAGRARAFAPMLARVPAHVAWLERQLGRYPFENYGVLVAPRYPNDAQESQTLSMFDAPDLLGPRSAAEPLMVHELVHHWFGDSVSPRTWADMWLNEGHATWYEWRYAIGFRRRGWFRRRIQATYAKSDRWRRRYGPVAAPTTSKLFTPMVYDVGALVLYALREKVGAAAFNRIERAWVREHRNGVASTRDFIALASRVAGQDLTAFLTEWLYERTTPPLPGR